MRGRHEEQDFRLRLPFKGRSQRPTTTSETQGPFKFSYTYQQLISSATTFQHNGVKGEYVNENFDKPICNTYVVGTIDGLWAPRLLGLFFLTILFSKVKAFLIDLFR